MTSDATQSTALRFGVNYTPTRGWMHSWLSFSPDDVRRDFEGIAQLGLDHVRIFPLWPVLQPNRTLIRQQALDDVRSVVDVGREFNLDVGVDVIQGHMSSFDFVPAWLYTWHDKNMFSHPDAVSGQVELVRRLGERLADADNFLGLTLGNEVNQFADDPHPSPWRITQEEAGSWLSSLLDAAATAAPNADHVHSEYDAVWYLDGHPFTPAHASRLGDMTTIHSWIFNGTARIYGGRSAASDRHAEYLIELSRAFQEGAQRPIWLQEVGAPSNCLSGDEIANFVEATVRSAARTENLWGVTWWCSHDVNRELADFPELEYSLGLITNDGRPKPEGLRYAEVARELRRSSAVEVPRRETAIVIEVDAQGVPVNRTAMSPGGAIFDAWVDLCERGIDACFITSADAENLTRRAARGITTLVRPDLSTTAVSRYSAVNTVV